MTVPPEKDPEGSGSSEQAPLDFDPYRFGRPEHPIPPEYAPPGYVPDTPPTTQPTQPAPVWPPRDDEQRAPYGGYPQYQPGQYPPSPYPPGPYQQGQYQQHPPPPPGYPAYGLVQQGNGKATTAMVLGILSIGFFWLTILDLGLAIPAIVIGALALRDAKRFPERGGRRKALTGLVCGIVSLAMIIATIAVVYVRIKPCFDYGVNSDAYNSCVRDKL
jgi:Domain of unknown function (DUF4190)